MKRYIRSAKQNVDTTELLDWYEKSKVSRNPETSPEILSVLSKDKDLTIRQYVAENPNTPVEILEVLARDMSSVRREVAENPNTPEHILSALAEDAKDSVRSEVAENPNTPVKILEKLCRSSNNSNDSMGFVRCGLARNVHATPKILNFLAKDVDESVRFNVAENPNTPKEVLVMLLQDDASYVRNSAAKNPNTPKDKIPPELLKPRTVKISWSRLIHSIQSDLESGTDPLYEQTDAGMQIQYACSEVDQKKGVQCIPSTQLGMGSMEIYDSDDNLLVDMDYQDYNNDVLSIALNSKNKTDFKRQYSELLDSYLR